MSENEQNAVSLDELDAPIVRLKAPSGKIVEINGYAIGLLVQLINAGYRYVPDESEDVS